MKPALHTTHKAGRKYIFSFKSPLVDLHAVSVILSLSTIP